MTISEIVLSRSRFVAGFRVVCSLIETVISTARTFAIFLLASLTILLTPIFGAEKAVSKPGVKEVQVPYSSIKPSVTLKIGGTLFPSEAKAKIVCCRWG